MIRKPFFTLLLLFTLFSGCKVIRPLPPSLPSSLLNNEPPPPSKIEVPFKVDLSNVFRKIDSIIPSDFKEEHNINSDFLYDWEIHKTDLQLYLNGAGALNGRGAVHGKATLKGKNPINGQWLPVCSGDANGRIGLYSSFNINPDYSLQGKVKLSIFTIDDLNLCKFNLNIKPIAIPFITNEINKALDGINQLIGTYKFKNLFEPVWDSLFHVIPISGVGYLSIHPSAIELGNPGGNESTLIFNAGIVVQPVVSLQNPGNSTPMPLPDISAVSGSGFNVYVDGHIQYPELNKLLKEKIAGKKIALTNHGYVLINDLQIYGNGNNRLIVKVNFKASDKHISYHGNFYITCLPEYDSTSQMLYISDIDFDSYTESSFKDKAVSWLLDAAIKIFFKDEVKIPLALNLNDMKDKLDKGLNRKLNSSVNITGKILNLNVVGILPENDYLLLRVNASGNMSVNIQ